MLALIRLFHWHDGGLDVSFWMIPLLMFMYAGVYAILDMALAHRRKGIVIEKLIEREPDASS